MVDAVGALDDLLAFALLENLLIRVTGRQCDAMKSRSMLLIPTRGSCSTSLMKMRLVVGNRLQELAEKSCVDHLDVYIKISLEEVLSIAFASSSGKSSTTGLPEHSTCLIGASDPFPIVQCLYLCFCVIA